MVPAIGREGSLIRVAFTLISAANWRGTGGYNYLVNLAQVLSAHAQDRVQMVLFVGTDAAATNVEPFAALPNVQVVRHAAFNDVRRNRRLRQALGTGCDQAAAQAFREHSIDVLFECAQFYGWRFPIPCVAWITDFQHRHLRELFSFGAYWKRDLGFRAQILSGRHVMLSSEDSRSDCETYFPRSVGRTSVVRSAMLPPDFSDAEGYGARAIARSYQLPESFFYLPNQFWKHKNHRTVIEALGILRQKGYNTVVAASGKAEDYRHPEHFAGLEALVSSQGLTHNFRFLGIVPRPHVFALMRAATALINPSLSEGWSTPVEEGKSLGVPMLLSDLRVHREQAGTCADFFDPEAAGQLALLMARHQDFPAPSRRDREKEAIAASQDRVKQFAIDFSLTVERAVALFPCERSHGQGASSRGLDDRA
jgi:glycosyltransferase involved in cell wall biosynthesis